MYTERDGYYFSCTKIRFNTIMKKLSDEHKNEIKSNITSNQVKFHTNSLIKISNEIINNRSLLYDKIHLHFLNKMETYYNKYNNLFDIFKTFIEILDITNSNLECSLKNNYTCPIISGSDSFLDIKQIRHPIIEQLGNKYIPNDININKNSCGILIYGVNSSGKSSCLKALGISIILAQAGLFVPCNNMTYYPFNNIISQVDLTDDIFTGKSSFINEMIGLKKILSICNSTTLVLTDELCKGTENYSANSILASTLNTMIETNTKFLFTTHLHDIPNIMDISKFQIKHLSVSIRDFNIIFDRILKDGTGSQLYGLEIAKSIINNTSFSDYAYNIRNKLTGEKVSVLSTKKSRYNSKKIIDSCEICGSYNDLQTDHIIEQQTADNNGFLQDKRHKNHFSNLCTLCQKCHLQKTLGKIIINGYVDSLNGKFLDWSKNI